MAKRHSPAELRDLMEIINQPGKRKKEIITAHCEKWNRTYYAVHTKLSSIKNKREPITTKVVKTVQSRMKELIYEGETTMGAAITVAQEVGRTKHSVMYIYKNF